MRNFLTFLVSIIIAGQGISQSYNQKIYADINVETSTIDAIDSLYLPAELFDNTGKTIFYLNGNLQLLSMDKQFKIIKLETKEPDSTRAIPLSKYSLSIPNNSKKNLIIPIKYKGEIRHEIIQGAALYARGFSETSGIIFEHGVYLAGSSYWVPHFELTDMSSFELTTTIDKGWNVVSQGERVQNTVENGKALIKYLCPYPMDEIYLIAAKWTEYSQQHDNVLVQAFLRTPDEALAQKYLRVTADYIRLYQDLIGDYPYTKFALVENFWETGYGMPSFTLLGESVIRFPWILHSSYPHELLHNYWGNSVFVDYETGNWCEGITVYMADHLIKEQQGAAGEYRRNTLQKFTDYVNPDNDFPVSEFLSRHNPAEEAIGYGKSMMFNDMLRLKVGDEKFKKSYARFYQENKFKKASFSDIQKSFEEVTGENLQAFFDQWIRRKGAPEIKLTDVTVKEKRGNYIVEFELSQIQSDDTFDLLIPVAIYLEGKTNVITKNISLNKRKKSYKMIFSHRPLKIEVDPQFNVFRRLDRKEVPTSISQMMGSKKGIIILPKTSNYLKAYEGLATMWQQTQMAQGKTLKIVYDSDIESLPGDMTAWVVGFDNKFANEVNIPAEFNEFLSADVINKINTAKESGSLVYTLSNPENNKLTLGFLATNDPGAIMSLARKLMHYGKYGYLAFDGDDANNTLKGIFPILDSPLVYSFKYNGISPKATARLEPRKALGY